MPKIAGSALLFRVFWVQLASSDSDGEPRSMLGGARVGEGVGAYRSAIPPAVRRRRVDLCPFSTSFVILGNFSSTEASTEGGLPKFQINPKTYTLNLKPNGLGDGVPR